MMEMQNTKHEIPALPGGRQAKYEINSSLSSNKPNFENSNFEIQISCLTLMKEV